MLYSNLTQTTLWGGSCPSEFVVLADVITDTTNDLLECEQWDHETVYSELADKVPGEKYLSDDIPFHQAKETDVELEASDHGRADVYVDDIITVAVDIKDNLQRVTRAPITVMHTVADNSTLNKTTIKRKDIVADDKMETEGAVEEEKIFWDGY